MKFPTRLFALGIFAASACLLGSLAVNQDALASPPPGPHGKPEPDMLGTHWAKDHTPPFARGTQVLNYHGGPVMSTGIQVQPIYWGQSWATDAQSKRTWLGTFYGGVGRSSYMATNTANDSSATFN